MNQPLTITIAESPWIPDSIARAGIRKLCQKRLNQEFYYDVEHASKRYQQVLENLKNSQLAIETEKANEQHYELPTAFFQAVLGPRLKYSASFFEVGDDLAAAENRSLQIYSERAQLKDGLQILELGCGWGSFTLWMAEKYPSATITAVSNSNSQRLHIMAQAKAKGFTNVTVITQDVNQLTFSEATFHRVVSVEMFEHVRNYAQLFKHIAHWLKEDGILWCHIFCHRFLQYPFEVNEEDDWMSAHFFSGGLMPAISTFSHFQDHLRLDQEWQWSGQHYEKTSNAWLKNMDKNQKQLTPIFEQIYGKDARIWWQRWRLFFMACAELFGYEQGNQWLIGHYRFTKR